MDRVEIDAYAQLYSSRKSLVESRDFNQHFASCTCTQFSRVNKKGAFMFMITWAYGHFIPEVRNEPERKVGLKLPHWHTRPL